MCRAPRPDPFNPLNPPKGFFSERRPLFAVDPSDGSLRNTDGGAPIIPIGLDDLPADNVGCGGCGFC